MVSVICACIDLKSFYASVECVERKLNPMTENLVVADASRGKGTICLAITPSMKKLGIRNRCRLFEIPESVQYITAVPRMRLYIEYSARIYEIYLKYFSAEDIHIYSVDEVFIDMTPYLDMYHMRASELVSLIRSEILEITGIPSTAGLGTNLYLAKIALDILAKKSPDGTGMLTESLYIKRLWNHTPLTDFWRIGKGTAKRLERYGIFTMGGIAAASEDLLYRNFGIDAELLIDHAYGRESVTMADIKKYVPKSHSLSNSQILMRDYDTSEAEIIVREMTDSLAMELCSKGLLTDCISIYIGYSKTTGVPSSHASLKLSEETDSDRILINEAVELYRKTVEHSVPVRKIAVSLNDIHPVTERQISLYDSLLSQNGDTLSETDRDIQKAVLDIRRKYGKSSILKGTSYLDAATARERNRQIGGHRSGD